MPYWNYCKKERGHQERPPCITGLPPFRKNQIVCMSASLLVGLLPYWHSANIGISPVLDEISFWNFLETFLRYFWTIFKLFWIFCMSASLLVGNFGILILIMIRSLVFGTPMFRILALYLEFEGAKNIHVLKVLIGGFGVYCRLLTGV